jgi:putative transposase
MRTVFLSLLSALCSCFRSSSCLRLENLALRHQINVRRRRGRRQLHLNNADRLLWVCLSRLSTGWRSALVIIKPGTVIRWHRKGFRLYWTWKSKLARPGRPDIPREVRDLIRKMSLANPLWGAPRIHGELLKLGIELSQATVAKYMVRHRKPPSQTWHTFLDSHLKQLVSTDFFVVPTLNFRILFVFVVLTQPCIRSASSRDRALRWPLRRRPRSRFRPEPEFASGSAWRRAQSARVRNVRWRRGDRPLRNETS